MMNVWRLFLILWLISIVLPAQAQTPFGAMVSSTNQDIQDPSAGQTSEQEIQELLRLLSNPALAEQLKRRLTEGTGDEIIPKPTVDRLKKRVRAARDHVKSRVREILQAIKNIPQLSNAMSVVWNEHMSAIHLLQSAIYVIIFIFGGFGLEWLYWTYLSGTLKRIEHSKPKTYGSILKAAILRAMLLFGSVAIFTVGSIGLFLSFDWSAFIQHIVLSLMIAIIAIRFIKMLTVFVLAPQLDDLRLLPLDKATAKNTCNWILIVSGIGLFGYLSVDTIDSMGIAPTSLLAIEVIAGLVFTFVLIGAIWQSESLRRNADASSTAGDGSEVIVPTRGPQNVKIVAWSGLILVAFILWLLNVGALMWTLVTLSFLFPAIKLSRIMVDHIFDNVEVPVEETAEQEKHDNEDKTQSKAPLSRFDLYRPIVDRLIRFVLVIVAFLTLGSVWNVAAMMQSATNTGSAKLFGIIIDVVFALLIADLIWTWAKTAINHKMSTIEPPRPGKVAGPEARMATLLPMFEKVLMVTIMIMTALIILSSLGVNIGPILAGAGVVGIALGFGAQALVKDILAGIFFLIEDAFRVGEYIEMGELRGTVKSVSIRSMQVRHHRGAIHTIPFGELKSLTNYSRDWVIMKLQFRVPFDTDLKLVKKLIKKVSANLLENADYGHHIIEPLKFQGVRRMEEFNMVIGVKFMTTPGEQWTIRRDAYQQIRDSFEANGIRFAQRNVTVEVVSDEPLTKEVEKAVVGAAQESIEQQISTT